MISRRGLLLGAVASVGVAGCSTDAPAAPRTSTTPVAPSTSVPTSAGPVRWDQLVRNLQGRVLRPGDLSYHHAALTENPRYDDARPLAVVSVLDAADVATTFAFAQDNGLPVAVRSGGHSYPGCSSGGARGTGMPRSIVIDCRPFNQVAWSGTTARIGSGLALAPAYEALSTRGRAIPGGSCATVGLGGLTLGGGVGVLTRDLGLTCDAVTGMEIVTADGKVRTISNDQDTDLFWALRGGGGGHLGVVTSFDFDTVGAPRVTTFYLSWKFSDAAAVIEAWQAWAPHADARLWSTCKVLGGATHPSGPSILVAGTWTGSGSPDLSGLLSHVPAPTAHTTTPRTYGEAMRSYAGCSSIPIELCHTDAGGRLKRESFGATSHVGYSALPGAGITTLLDHVENAQGSGLKEAGLSMDALGGKVRDLSNSDTAFVHRDALMTVQYTATFTGDRGAQADTFTRGFRSALTPYWDQHAYVNYSDPTLRNPAQAYFGANAKRLAGVRKRYDPDGFFTQPQAY